MSWVIRAPVRSFHNSWREGFIVFLGLRRDTHRSALHPHHAVVLVTLEFSTATSRVCVGLFLWASLPTPGGTVLSICLWGGQGTATYGDWMWKTPGCRDQGVTCVRTLSGWGAGAGVGRKAGSGRARGWIILQGYVSKRIPRCKGSNLVFRSVLRFIFSR